jgi:hypothetical protein
MRRAWIYQLLALAWFIGVPLVVMYAFQQFGWQWLIGIWAIGIVAFWCTPLRQKFEEARKAHDDAAWTQRLKDASREM